MPLRARTTASLTALSDLLLWGALVEPGTLLNKDGSLTAAFAYTVPDTDSSTPEELTALTETLNRALLPLGDGWTLQTDAIRVAAPPYPTEGAFPDPVTRLIDRERREQHHATPLFTTHFYLTLTWQAPPPQRTHRVRRFLTTADDLTSIALAAPQETFRAKLAELTDVFGSVLPLTRLTDHDLLQYLHRTLTGLDHPVAVPEDPSALDTYLASADLYGGLSPRIGDAHIACLSFTGLPLATRPALLHRLHSIPAPFRFNTRFLPFDPGTAASVLGTIRRQWMRTGRNLSWFVRTVKEGAANDPELSRDDAALNMLRDIDAAVGEAKEGSVRFGHYTASLLFIDPDRQALAEHLRATTQELRTLGIPVRIETVNALEVFLGSLPAHRRENVRRMVIHTRNLAHLLPTTAPWPGHHVNPSPLSPPGGCPALLWTRTDAATPFHLNLHAGDVAHTLLVGPTGAGKSAAIAALIASWFRYPDAQVIAFDKGYSFLPLALATGATHYDLGADDALAFCPLAHIDRPTEFDWAADWLETITVTAGVQMSPALRRLLRDALALLRAHPDKSLTNLYTKLQQPDLRSALRPFTSAEPGVGATLLDAHTDHVSDARFLCLEMSHLMEDLGPRYMTPVLMYLFHRLTEKLGGAPTLIAIDEAWTFVDNPTTAPKIRQWLKELRKLNAAVLFSTQSLADLRSSPLREVLAESCATKLFLPNPQATHEVAADFYKSLGLNSRQLELIAQATPKRDLYAVSPHGNRLFQLHLPPLALAFCGTAAPEHLRAVRALAKVHGDGWPSAWLEQRGLPGWAEALRQLV